ncbi:MAG: hypothetical protein ACK4SZ_03040 [Allosphingosinicella sp.]|uniref:hypothetical protein n=1 Tax=Allosphingosinicella sp. TaxID=2823234 RepID=UPI00393C467F
MDRRHFIAGASAAALIPTSAKAELVCSPFDAWGIQQCTVGIPMPAIEASHVGSRQEMQNWCWAACISSIFSWHGHPVAQHRIVEKIFGGYADLPATGEQIFYAVSGDWIDDNGSPFRAHAGVLLDANYSFRDPNAAPLMAEDLAQRYPLIVGASGHATVVTALSYVQDVYRRYQITEVVIRDPWPLSPSRRALTPTEMNNAILLTRVRVQSLL